MKQACRLPRPRVPGRQQSHLLMLIGMHRLPICVCPYPAHLTCSANFFALSTSFAVRIRKFSMSARLRLKPSVNVCTYGNSSIACGQMACARCTCYVSTTACMHSRWQMGRSAPLGCGQSHSSMVLASGAHIHQYSMLYHSPAYSDSPRASFAINSAPTGA